MIEGVHIARNGIGSHEYFHNQNTQRIDILSLSNISLFIIREMGRALIEAKLSRFQRLTTIRKESNTHWRTFPKKFVYLRTTHDNATKDPPSISSTVLANPKSASLRTPSFIRKFSGYPSERN